ncbi:MAG: hypothetical protein ACLFSK_00405 [Ectothiorhodospira sp.]
MFFRRTLVAMALVAGAVAPAAADTLDAYLSQETAQFTYLTDSERIGFGGADMSLGLFFDDEDDVMLSTGLSVAGVPAGERPLTFGVADDFYDLGLRYELEVTPGARGFIGYRLMEADLDRGGDYELDDNVHFGVRLDF